MISPATLKRWKRDALEEQFKSKANNYSNPTLNLQCERVARLCHEIEKLRNQLELYGGSNGHS